ncbi:MULTISPECIES: Mov34/MPN/PAD-1 family protein [Vibrio]|uniref:MPN domain-containing protein n=1 Tax=Vibrio kanaloae TaxID=170673 RepID=A0A4U1ZVS6_9VIBR|nr:MULTISPECIES: Mov34/MPN/PAD-1 family protein [Vibrio]MCX8859961.1 Mov34/MPN/PAD-1 family protein [Vibrio parahaemolyticus]MCX8865133.1 Mov34/MPN/PAD-1 family protein [Vibrio parahaemolyticus]MCX8870258.1 Mov34/MPN/PAD-1 family protein [Vibrio parahaemolyticus]MCX8900473.1 Mov34/MPN/PAD-1 family protein [Vibrio parahaemolyticus]MCX8920773.1 Mov34/MPN/PAD-1 family protein [Vibrio parahaemolyticus]
MIDRYFSLPNSAGTLQFSGSVLEHIYSYAQIKRNDKEAGGQLFSMTPHKKLVVISLATGPNSNDTRSMTHFNPCLRQLNKDRERLFNDGFHAVGLWHTHPESTPNPSNEDRITTLKYLEAFNGDMSGFIQVIIGNNCSLESLCVWLASTDKNNRWVKLKEVKI